MLVYSSSNLMYFPWKKKIIPCGLFLIKSQLPSWIIKELVTIQDLWSILELTDACFCWGICLGVLISTDLEMLGKRLFEKQSWRSSLNSSSLHGVRTHECADVFMTQSKTNCWNIKIVLIAESDMLKYFNTWFGFLAVHIWRWVNRTIR